MKIHNFVYYIILFAIGIVSHFRWFLFKALYTSGDWNYVSNIKYLDYSKLNPLWINMNFGVTSSVPQFYIIRFLEGNLYKLFGFDFAINEKIFFLIPIVILPLIGSFNLFKKFSSKRAALVGAIFFSYSTPYLANQAGGLTLAIGFALSPLLISQFLDLLSEKKNIFIRSIVFSLLLSVSILYELRVTIITIIIISIIFLKTVVEHNYEKFFLIQSLKKLSIVSIITLLLQSFWLLPFLLAKGTSSSVVELANRSIFYSFVRLHNALTIHHPFWTSQKPVAFVHNSIPIIYSLIPILIISTLILYNQKKLTNKAHSWVSVWIIISLIGILLTKQNHAPFAGLYEFLYEHLPGFSLYRESTKFFLFTLLGYSALIVIGYDYWSKMISSRAKFKNFLLILVSVIYLVIPLTNIIPIFNGDFETMFTPRIKSNDYSLIEKKLNEDQFFYRTLWVPKDSRWTPDNNLHPKVSLTNVVNEDWSKYLDDPFSDTLFSKISNMMSKESLFESLIKGGSIKYVFVPIQDTANDDDFFIHYGGDEVHEIRNWYIKKLKEMKFLKEIDLGLEDVVAFENTSFSNYLDISNNIVNLDSKDNINSKLKFIKDNIIDDFDFVMNDDLNSSDFGSTVGIFDNLDSEEIKDTFIEKNFNNTNLVNHDLYINLNFKNLSSIVEGSKLNLYTENKQNLYQNRSKILHPINKLLVKSIDLEADSSYYIINGEEIIPIKTDEFKNSYGEFDDNITIIKTKNKNNQIPNPSFDEPILWQDQIGNCNNNSESTSSSSSMKLKGDQNYLELGAYKSISCTSTNTMSVDSSKRYMLSFDFQSPNSKFAGYHIGFDNKNKELSEKIPVIDSQWGNFHKIVNVPQNSTKATLTVYSYSSSGDLILTGYDNFNFAEFEDLGIIKIKEPTANFQKLSLDQQTNKFTYFDPSLKYDNLITNYSFEEGLLSQKVGNCNEYDNNPSISMSLSNDAKSGKQSLQLETKRHTACFSPGVFRVKEGQVYNFSFWYKSEKAKQVGYYIGFNDINKISTNKRVDVFNDDWNKVTETFRVPKGATTASIFINNFESSNSEVIKTNFDDLKLIKLPDLSGKYYLVNHSLVEKNNTQVEYNIVNPTTINLSINNITDPSYLKFSQSYHSQWKLRPKSSTKFSDENHFSLYGYLNGWYIDPTDVCLKYIDSCSLRPDGSYDIEMVIEFWPQRIFNLGLVVSSATLLSIVIYIGYSYWRKKKTKVKSNKIILKSSSQQIEVFINKVKKFILIGKPVDKTNVIQKTQQKRLKTNSKKTKV